MFLASVLNLTDTHAILRHTIFLIQTLCATFILWLGLYVLTRDLPLNRESLNRWRGLALLAGSGLVLLALYLYGVAAEIMARDALDYAHWMRITRWGIPVAIAFFFWALILLIYTDTRIPLWLRLLYSVILAFALLLAIGFITGFLVEEDRIRPTESLFQPYFLPTRPPFNYIITFYVNGGLLSILVLLIFQIQHLGHGRSERRKYALLTVGILFGLLGAMLNFLLSPLTIPQMPKQIGDYIATIGAAVIGFGIARFNALDHEKIIEYDFWHSLTNVTVSVALFLISYYTLFRAFGYPIQPMVAVTGGAYSRHLKQARTRLGRVLFDRELSLLSHSD